MKKKELAEVPTISVKPISTESADIYVFGKSPLVVNRMSEKAKHELLMPRGRLSGYEKMTNLKHDPVAEFRAAAYRLPQGETLLALPSTAFKGCLSTAALDIPAVKKAQVARLTFVENEYVPIWGLPRLYMAVVRSSGIDRVPDIRTRVIIPEWCAKFTVTWVLPMLSAGAIMNLIAAGGVYVGVGDGRPERGKLSFGRFETCQKTSADFLRLQKFAARKQQTTALELAEPYDDESREMMTWFADEIARRRFESTSKTKSAAKKQNGPEPPAMNAAHQEENLAQ
jgi:hypothetical protein